MRSKGAIALQKGNGCEEKQYVLGWRTMEKRSGNEKAVLGDIFIFLCE